MNKIWKKIKLQFPNRRLGDEEAKIVLYAGVGLVMGIIVTAVLYRTPELRSQNNWQEVLDMYYDPMLLMGKADDIALIDIRSADDFNKGHIESAVNIPFENNKTFVSKIQKIRDKQVVLYGETVYSLTPFQAADELARSNIDVQVLRVGWNEFAFFPSFWMSQDQATEVNIIDYLALPEASSP